MIALATGLVFAKFSRATAWVAFSSCAVVTVHDGKPTLMFRVGNRRGNVILDAQIRVAASRRVTLAEGGAFYRIYDLPLVRDRQIGKHRWVMTRVVEPRR